MRGIVKSITTLFLVLLISSIAQAYPVYTLPGPSTPAFGPYLSVHTFETSPSIYIQPYYDPTGEISSTMTGTGTFADQYNISTDIAHDAYQGFGNFVLRGDNNLYINFSSPYIVKGVFVSTNQLSVPITFTILATYTNGLYTGHDQWTITANQAAFWLDLHNIGAISTLTFEVAPNIARISIDQLGGTPSTPPTIPEPVTIMLMGVGLIGLGYIGKKRSMSS